MSQILESKKNISTLMDENEKLVDERLGETKRHFRFNRKK